LQGEAGAGARPFSFVERHATIIAIGPTDPAEGFELASTEKDFIARLWQMPSEQPRSTRAEIFDKNGVAAVYRED